MNIERARELRRDPTETEQRLWSRLRHRQLGGYRFRRQHPVGPYIADFACLRAKLIVEVDGSQHVDADASDAQRDAFLQVQGFRVLRFWNHQVWRDLDAVLETIHCALANPPR